MAHEEDAAAGREGRVRGDLEQVSGSGRRDARQRRLEDAADDRAEHEERRPVDVRRRRRAPLLSHDQGRRRLLVGVEFDDDLELM